MKQILGLIFLLTLTNSMAQTSLEWSFFHPLRSEWLDLGKSGSVQEALMKTAELPDPFYGLNEEKFAWIEDHDWKLKAIFFLTQDELQKTVELDFSGIDTYAHLSLNGVFIDSFENAFIPYHLKLDSGLKVGLNELELLITPPVRYHKLRWETERYHLPAPNDVHKIAVAPYTRKPQYQFGWDWSLRLNTIGLTGPAVLRIGDKARVINKSIRVLELTEDEATLEFVIELSDKSIQELTWNSALFGDAIVKSADALFRRTVSLSNPELWWPRGMGAQSMYTDLWSFKSSDSKMIANQEVDFGVKTSELITETDQWGTSYYFKINGERVFAKGANYIPQDIFPDRIQDEDIEELVQQMAVSNFNMVRVWGGGFYQKEAFYKACDRLGIMVWQDLMFACAMYPGDSSFLANVQRELKYQIARISAHPSVVLFNGNNEVEVAWGNWGFQIKYGLYGESAKEIEKAYDDLFKQLAPEVIEANSSIPYIHTSPLSNWGKDDYYNHGSQHYWGVWHGKDPIEDFGKKIGRFNAEYGFQSFPEYNTLHTFSTEADWDISSPVMKQHQKSYVGNDMILKHAKRLYGTPTDFKQFVYYSQLTQAMAVSMAIAGHRIDAPRCGGTLYWQLNDCWPVSSWSSIDYYGNWKALQYRAKDDYRDLAILERFSDLENRSYYLVSDHRVPQSVNYNWQVVRLNGKVIDSGEGQIEIEKDKPYELKIDTESNGCRDKHKSHQLIISINNGSEEYTRSFDMLGSKYEQEVANRTVCLELVSIDEIAKSAILRVTNDEFVADLWLVSSKFGVRFDRNFISLLPGTHDIKIAFEELPEQSDFEFYYR
jgi:beta-mannosidase